MGAVAITSQDVRKDLETLCFKAKEMIKKLDDREIDFQKIIGDIFSQKGYSYTLKKDGDFNILVADGIKISGIWTGKIWKVYLEVNHGDIEVTTNLFYMENLAMNISPAAFEEYIPVFDYLISSLEKLSIKYQKNTKDNKSSQLLSMLVTQLIEELKLTAEIEPTNKKGGLLKLQRQLSGNLALTSLLDFDNYENRCQEMQKAEKLIPPIAETEFIKSIYYRSPRWKVSPEDFIEVKPNPYLNDDNIKMVYNKSAYEGHGELFNHEGKIFDYDKDIIECLNKYGFKYFIDSRDNLAILMNSKFWIVVKNNKIYTIRHYSQRDYVYDDVEYYHARNGNPRLNITKESLFTLLKYIASASMANKNSEMDYKKYVGDELYWYSKKGAFPIIFNQLLEFCLPKGYFYFTEGSNGDTRVFLDKEGERGLLWKSEDENWIEIFLYVVREFDKIFELPHCWDNMKLNGVKLTI